MSSVNSTIGFANVNNVYKSAYFVGSTAYLLLSPVVGIARGIFTAYEYFTLPNVLECESVLLNEQSSRAKVAAQYKDLSAIKSDCLFLLIRSIVEFVLPVIGGIVYYLIDNLYVRPEANEKNAPNPFAKNMFYSQIAGLDTILQLHAWNSTLKAALLEMKPKENQNLSQNDEYSTS